MGCVESNESTLGGSKERMGNDLAVHPIADDGAEVIVGESLGTEQCNGAGIWLSNSISEP